MEVVILRVSLGLRRMIGSTKSEGQHSLALKNLYYISIKIKTEFTDFKSKETEML